MPYSPSLIFMVTLRACLIKSSNTTHEAGVKISHGGKHYFIWISTICEIFKKGINQNRKVGHQKDADVIRVFFCKEST